MCPPHRLMRPDGQALSKGGRAQSWASGFPSREVCTLSACLLKPSTDQALVMVCVAPGIPRRPSQATPGFMHMDAHSLTQHFLCVDTGRRHVGSCGAALVSGSRRRGCQPGAVGEERRHDRCTRLSRSSGRGQLTLWGAGGREVCWTSEQRGEPG